MRWVTGYISQVEFAEQRVDQIHFEFFWCKWREKDSRTRRVPNASSL